MNTLLTLFPSGQWTQILLLLLVLAVAWILLRFVLRLAVRVFSIGCGLIVLLGLVLLAYNYFR
jgi:accessory gene regulator protein AgrB